MRYKVPKFLEREILFFNILTFKQLAVLAGIGLAMFILYYILPKGVFFPLLIIVVFSVFALLFVRIQGVPLHELIVQFFGFFVSSRKYFWRKKEALSSPIKLRKEEEKEKEAPLKISPGSKLRDLASRVEIGIR